MTADGTRRGTADFPPFPDQARLPADAEERQAFLDDLGKRAKAGDAEAMHAIGRIALRSRRRDGEEVALQWFALAERTGGTPMTWRAVSELFDRGSPTQYGEWMGRAITAEFPLPDAPGITVEPTTFGPWPPGDEIDMVSVDASFQVRSADPEAATRALDATWPRLVAVDERGRELSEDEDDGETYTPNYASDPREHSDGPYIRIDTKDAIWGPMARTWLLIVVQELLAAGVTEAVIGPSPRPG